MKDVGRAPLALMLMAMAGGSALAQTQPAAGPPVSLLTGRPTQATPNPAPALPAAPVATIQAPAPPTPVMRAAPPPAAAPVALPRPAPLSSVPHAAPAAPPAPMGAATAMEVVRGFYAALAAADGARANQYVIAEKRDSGPYAVAAMNAFYGAMAEPLRLLDAAEIMPGLVRVRYQYLHRSGRRCDGTADVIVARHDETLLIERVRAYNGC